MSRKRNRNRQQNRDYWELIKEAFGIVPKDVDGQFNLTVEYYKSELMNILKGRFDIVCPDFWDTDFLLDTLIIQGKVVISDSSIGVAPFTASPFGLNVFQRASQVTVINEILGTWDKWLCGNVMKKENAVLLYLFNNRSYRSFNETIDMTAQRLANIDCSIDVNIMNTRVAFIFNADNEQQSEEAKSIYSKISSGEPAVYTKVKDALHPEFGGLDVQAFPAKDVFIADKLFELKQSVMSEFLTRIGINSTAYEKKERLLVDEVNGNNGEIKASLSYINYNLEKCSKKVRDLFDIDFSIKMRIDDEQSISKKDINKETDA